MWLSQIASNFTLQMVEITLKMLLINIPIK